MKTKKELQEKLREAITLRNQMFDYYNNMSVFENSTTFYNNICEVRGIIEALETTLGYRYLSFTYFKNLMK